MMSLFENLVFSGRVCLHLMLYKLHFHRIRWLFRKIILSKSKQKWHWWVAVSHKMDLKEIRSSDCIINLDTLHFFGPIFIFRIKNWPWRGGPSHIRAGQILFRGEWVMLVVKITILSHWGLVPANFLLWKCGEQRPQSLLQ